MHAIPNTQYTFVRNNFFRSLGQALTGQIEAHKDDRSPAAKEIVHLGLLGVKATRTREGQAYLEGFAESARGELRALVRKLLTPAGSGMHARPKASMRPGGSR